MISKNELTNEIIERLKDLFVNDFDKVNNAKENINVYLKYIEIEPQYDYNNFCVDFLKISEKLINSLTVKDIESIDPLYIIGEIMGIMVKYKIMENEKDETVKLQKIIQHELRIKNIREDNTS